MGNPNGPGIVFIHGFSQSNLSWMRQTHSDLTKEFHIVTYDLRGHGDSEKPLEAARYRDGKAWADEVQAVIDAAGLKRPVLVGWSYAGRVISDYVTYRGATAFPASISSTLLSSSFPNLSAITLRTYR